MLDRCAEDFPDVSISKIRFLEAEGLLTPERTASGYRLYCTTDVERLRWCCGPSATSSGPCKVIREALDGPDRGLDPAATPRPAAPRSPPPRTT